MAAGLVKHKALTIKDKYTDKKQYQIFTHGYMTCVI